MVKKTAALAILEQLSSEERHVVSDWRALILLRRATLSIAPETRRWSALPEDISEIYPLLRQMTARGELIPLPKLGYLYRVAPPHGSKAMVTEYEALMEVHPYAVISHHSALLYHRLTDISPQKQTVIVPGFDDERIPPGTVMGDWESLPYRYGLGWEPKSILKWHMQWIRARPDRYFSFRSYQPSDRSGYAVQVTTPERTLVDVLQEPERGGGIENVLRGWARARDTLNLDVLIEIVEHFNINVLRQRVGFILDRMNLSHPSVEAWRAHAARGGSSRLLASAPYAPAYSERWNLSINTPAIALLESAERDRS